LCFSLGLEQFWKFSARACRYSAFRMRQKRYEVPHKLYFPRICSGILKTQVPAKEEKENG